MGTVIGRDGAPAYCLPAGLDMEDAFSDPIDLTKPYTSYWPLVGEAYDISMERIKEVAVQLLLQFAERVGPARKEVAIGSWEKDGWIHSDGTQSLRGVLVLYKYKGAEFQVLVYEARGYAELRCNVSYLPSRAWGEEGSPQ